MRVIRLNKDNSKTNIVLEALKMLEKSERRLKNQKSTTDIR